MYVEPCGSRPDVLASGRQAALQEGSLRRARSGWWLSTLTRRPSDDAQAGDAITASATVPEQRPQRLNAALMIGRVDHGLSLVAA
jgi:hypothetical protein